MSHIATQEHFSAGLTELHRTQVGTHSILRHHPPSDGGRFLDIVRRSGSGIVEHDFFSNASTHRVGELVE